jgi:hypothetical protein
MKGGGQARAGILKMTRRKNPRGFYSLETLLMEFTGLTVIVNDGPSFTSVSVSLKLK